MSRRKSTFAAFGYARASISHANDRDDVPRHALAVVCARIRAARVLPLLFFLGRARLRALSDSRCSFFALTSRH